jgi:ubiquinone/menaquinone biosynthesis C-methylase UbiE
MGRINYDDRLHSVYAQGRALIPETVDTWMAALARHTPLTRPLKVLDLGSGAGRFSPALAGTFGGPVYGLDPSEKMIEVALTEAGAGVHYVRAIGEAIPLADASVDVALLYFVLHHIADKRRAAAELARVIARQGRLFIRTNFCDRMPDAYWFQFFARAKDVDASMYQSLDEVIELFAGSGFRVVTLEEVEFMEAPSRGALLDRLRHRALSTFEFMRESEIQEGFLAMERAVAEEPDSKPVVSQGDLLVLSRH